MESLSTKQESRDTSPATNDAGSVPGRALSLCPRREEVAFGEVLTRIYSRLSGLFPLLSFALDVQFSFPLAKSTYN